MDIQQSLEYKYENDMEYNNLGILKYNYGKEGVLNKCLPKVLFKGNSILVTVLQAIDLKIILLLKYIDKLKQFKYISSY